MRNLTEISVSGYVAHEIDFPALLGRQSQALQDLVQAEVIAPLTNAQIAPAAGKSCVITVIGHSDRVDTPGLTPEQRRAEELSASLLRAESAQAYLFSELFSLVQAAGGTPPVDLASMQTGAIWTVAAGAANLTHTVPASEEERQENRRVVLKISTFDA